MFAISLNLSCERISAVKLDVCDRNDMHILGVTKVKIEIAHEAAFVAHVPNLSDTTLVWENPLRLLL